MENKARATFLQISTNVSQNLEITQSVEEIFPARRNYPWQSIIYPSFTHKQSLLFNTNIPYPPDPSRNQKKKKSDESSGMRDASPNLSNRAIIALYHYGQTFMQIFVSSSFFSILDAIVSFQYACNIQLFILMKSLLE